MENSIPVQKNKEYIVQIIDNGYEGEGIAKINNFTIFIPNAIKGETIKVLIVKVLSSHAFGKIIEIINKSKVREEVDCLTYNRCGGCNLRHIKYGKTLELKQNVVQNLVDKTLNKKIKVNSVIGMGNPYYYRNKVQFPLGIDKEGNPQIGIYAQRTHEIIPIRDCKIYNPIFEQIANYIFTYIKRKNLPIYNEKTREGIFRHIVIKTGIYTHEVMCILVLNKKEFDGEKELADLLVKEFPQIKTIVKNINMKNTNVILGEDCINLYGDGYIYDILGEYTFKISPLAFYQINPVQTEMLYYTAIDMAEISKDDIVYDLYCGIGTIGIFASKYAKKVYGIEIVKEAIESAKENAEINNIKNIDFMAGDVEKVFMTLLKKWDEYPDVLIVDPPRKGLDFNTLENIKSIEPKKIVYISCNPATLVRDLKELEEKYDIKEIQPVDMFPFTKHIENITILKLR